MTAPLIGADGRRTAAWLAAVAAEPARLRLPLLRAECARDPLLWGRLVYPEVTRAEYSGLHTDIGEWFALLPTPAERAGQSPRRRVVTGPRGGAKTTLLRLGLLHRLLHRLEPYALVVGPEATHCDAEMGTLRGLADSTDRPLLRRLHGPREWSGNLSEVRLTGGGGTVYLSARPISGTIRGMNRDGQRPTLVILDDVEKPEHLDSPSTRARMRARLSDDIGNLGPPEGGLACIYGATDLGEGSLPSHAELELGWDRSTVPAVLAWPEGLHEGVDAPGSLWEACRRLYLDRTDRQRRETARDFFDAHRAEMVRGARVLHPVYQPLWSLVERLWDGGRVGFFRDYQQRPLSGDAQVFAVGHIRRARVLEDGEHLPVSLRLHDGLEVSLADCDVGIWLDPRNSDRPDRNDFSGLAVVAVHRRTGLAVVAEHVAVREKPADSVARLWGLWERWRRWAPRVGAEANQGGALLGNEWGRLQREADRARRPSAGPLALAHTTGAKGPRLASLGLPLETGQLQLADVDAGVMAGEVSRMTLAAQLAGFPRASVHDDGLDAVERAYALARESAEAGVSLDVLRGLEGVVGNLR
jgi:hypothetical protein